MKKLAPLIIATVFLILTLGLVLPLAPTAVAQQAENGVWTDFKTYWIYDSPEDTFTNSEVTGRKEWHADIGSEVPLTGLALTLDSTLNFDHIMKENLTTMRPPTYVWSFGDVSPGMQSNARVGFKSLYSLDVALVTFTPGFDASRSVDRIEFSAPGTQTLTITLTPREGTERFGIFIHADESDLVNPVITSPTSGDGIELRQEGHRLFISPTNLQIDTTWTITVTIQVTPKVPEVEFMPDVGIEWHETLASGTASGNSLSLPVTDMGMWTWSAEGSYEWDWTDRLYRQVQWRFYPGEISKGNQVKVFFGTSWDHFVYGDSFTNAEVNGHRGWRMWDIINTPDETGEPIRGLRAKFDGQLDFDWVQDIDLVRRGPPTYEWFYGDISEDYVKYRSHPTIAWVKCLQHIDKLAPGFDVYRTFDKTVFTGPDTQTMTVTITPREEWLDRVSLRITTYPHKLVDASITSVISEGSITLPPDGRMQNIEDIPAQLNTPVNITVTTKVTPKVPEVEFKPHTEVKFIPPGPSETIRGTSTGSSFSRTNEAGTWTVSAEGDYVWTWEDGIKEYRVELCFRDNTPPTLISAGVSPPSGTPETDFTFEVTYRDTDRGEGGTSVPSYVCVYIDGSARDMGKVGGKYADGALFSYTATLNAGSHTYYFEASDGFFTARFPEDGTLSIEVPGTPTSAPAPSQEPTPAPSLAPTPSQAISWQVLIGIVAGVVIIGLVTYFFIRRRRRV